MQTAALTILEIELEDPAAEVDLLAWWDDVRRLLTARNRLTRADLCVMGRGRYLAQLGFPLPGAWKLIQADRRWQELERRRPGARITTRHARLWHLEGNPRDVTTAELSTWLQERADGRRDFVLVDTLAPDSYAEQHIPGAVNLPVDELAEDAAARVIGADRDRAVVVYCSSYG